jgi:predicted enzyme related to lactoylglutathione lyase
MMPHGKICYIEIPADDVDQSAAFYSKIFGWSLRTRGDGARAFDDATGGVSGTWVSREKAPADAMRTYIMVDNIETALEQIEGAGGKIKMPYTRLDANSGFAIFLDPAGNEVGLYEQRSG